MRLNARFHFVEARLADCGRAAQITKMNLDRQLAFEPQAVDAAAGTFVVSSLADARQLLGSAAVSMRPAIEAPPCADTSGMAAIVARGVALRALWMWGADPDRHARVRKLAAGAIGPRAVTGLLSRVAAEAPALVEQALARPGSDLVRGFVAPLVRNGVFALFGIYGAKAATLLSHFAAMTPFARGVSEGLPDVTPYFALAAAAGTIDAIWQAPLPEEARAARALLDAVACGSMTRDEALSQAIVMLFGNETTVDALSGLIARLSERPDVWAALRHGELAVEEVVEEGLRLGPPIHMTLVRAAQAPITCASRTIPAGATIRLPLGAINRDPEAFANPGVFDPARKGPKHLAFGAGSGMCVGAHLARAIMGIAVGAMVAALEWWPRATILCGPIRTTGTGVVRITLDPASA